MSLASRARLAAAIGTGALLATGAARADEPLCPNAGQVVSSQTEGHCCWPQQTWDPAQQMCAGMPACPNGMVRDGLACAAPKPPVVTDPGFKHNPLPTAPPPQSTMAPTNASTASRSVGGILVGAGIVGMGAGYLASAGVGVWSLFGKPKECRAGAGWSFVPLAGSFITVGEFSSDQACNNPRTPVLATAVTSEILQLGGAAMLGVGVALLVIPGPPPKASARAPELIVAPGAPGADVAGLTLGVRGF